MPNESIYIELSSEVLILDYLEKVEFFIDSAQTKQIDWKWVIQSLHGALYKTSIIACKDSSGGNIKRKDGKLISIDVSIKNCLDISTMNKYVFSKHLSLNEKQRKSIHDLNQTFRNNFEHFHPGFWAIEIHYLPMIVLNIFDIIEFLIFESGNCINFTHEQKGLIKKHITNSSYILKQSQLYKEYLLVNNES